MSITKIDIGEPFFSLELVEDEQRLPVLSKTIVVNLSVNPITIEKQKLAEFQSNYVMGTDLVNVDQAILIRNLRPDLSEQELCDQVGECWPSAYQVRKEERLRNVGHYMSPKEWVGQQGFTFYYSATVPLNVGLHRDHSFCPVPGYREVHTQIVGLGKMQQCLSKDLSSLYFEELMAPGNTHRPMYNQKGEYPWHQYETITPSVFLAIEVLPEGATPPE
jgi:hypothetical protein